ncbi:MAG: hypothetical protein KDA60_07965, partial [Planctomycetales bacterium]|nr:hypothetical protein [Planctomycetales bacterium]
MQDAFELQHDYDVYCYLKKTLAPEYDVQAWPNTQYYSEWLFDYEVRKAGATVARLRGDFRDLD